MPNKNPNAHEPAQPVQNARIYDYCGLTKREQIAAQIMAGFAASNNDCSVKSNAESAVEWADALIDALEK